MLRWNVWKLALASLAAAVTLGADAKQADAFWWRHHGASYGCWGSSGGSYGSWGSSGGWYASSGGSYGSWGFRAWRHHRHASHGSWGSSGGSYGSWGSSGGSYGSWGSSGGSYGGSSGGVIVDPSPTPPAATAPMSSAAPSNAAMLNVNVPAEAKVFVNGMATTSTGSSRRYMSNGLEPGFSYTYELRAEIVRDGKTVTETKSVKLHAGENANVSFGFDGENQVAKEPARTSLTLQVPAEAKVYLAGNATNSSGEVREFATDRLTAGEEWKDYAVRVEIERDGQILSRENKITLRGGESRKMAIEFDEASVASIAGPSL